VSPFSHIIIHFALNTVEVAVRYDDDFSRIFREGLTTRSLTLMARTARATLVSRVDFYTKKDVSRLLVGGLVFGKRFGIYLQFHEWISFMSNDTFCFRACVRLL
jgi:hypothetical protein